MVCQLSTGCSIGESYFQRREMNNTVDMWVGSEDLVEGSFITYVNVVEMRSLSANQSAVKFRVSKA